ncbi:hypothetical protein [Prochlorothrix hollandica]|nr:hypothetical protein [Prochlorothrix hollandica]
MADDAMPDNAMFAFGLFESKPLGDWAVFFACTKLTDFFGK